MPFLRFFLFGSPFFPSPQVWDLRKLSLLTTLGAPASGASVCALRFDQCAQYLAVGGSAGLQVYSAKTWEPLCAQPAAALGGAPVGVGFAPDALALVGASSKKLFACCAPA